MSTATWTASCPVTILRVKVHPAVVSLMTTASGSPPLVWWQGAGSAGGR
jgi:hypothetical protein